ncbi:DUF5069 domain-containing protein [Candidatus Woesearchaeota archaeon]|nr:DUF5069 domain-containing protein [Candidatus Woesearchaeota archaeon]
MDLIRNYPRSPFEMMAGIVMLPRTIDKTKAFNANKLGEYHYNCPLDQAVFEFLSISSEEFARKVADLETDEKIEKWISSIMKDKTKAEKHQFNNYMRHSKPETPNKIKWMENEKKKIGRNDYFSYFDNIDADEKRF